MARLPDLIIEKIEISQLGSDSNIEIFYKMIGQGVRKAEMNKKKKDNEDKKRKDDENEKRKDDENE